MLRMTNRKKWQIGKMQMGNHKYDIHDIDPHWLTLNHCSNKSTVASSANPGQGHSYRRLRPARTQGRPVWTHIGGCVQRHKHPCNGLSKRERGLRKEKGAFEKGRTLYHRNKQKHRFFMKSTFRNQFSVKFWPDGSKKHKGADANLESIHFLLKTMIIKDFIS